MCLFRPHVLLLDEPTNNLSLDAINALAIACQDFEGAIVLVSHNFDFLCQVCKELVVVDKGTVSVKRSIADVSKVPSGNTEKVSKSAKSKGAAPIAPAAVGEETFSDILEAYIISQVEPI